MIQKIINKNNEKLFLCVATSSNDPFYPSINFMTWDKAIELLEDQTRECNDESWMKKRITFSIDEKHQRARAQMLMNHKGWGSDFFMTYTIEEAYYFD